MIIAFDGNVYSGKTTIINKLSHNSGYNVIQEHTFFINQIPANYGISEFDVHLRYMRVDSFRKKKILRGVNLLDRSFVSLSAHIYGLYIYKKIDLRREYLIVLKKMLAQGDIIIPDVYIFIYCDWKTASKRFILSKDDGRNTTPIFKSKKYFHAINDFNMAWQKITNSMNIISTIKSNSNLLDLRSLDGKNFSHSSIIRNIKAILYN